MIASFPTLLHSLATTKPSRDWSAITPVLPPLHETTAHFDAALHLSTAVDLVALAPRPPRLSAPQSLLANSPAIESPLASAVPTRRCLGSVQHLLSDPD